MIYTNTDSSVFSAYDRCMASDFDEDAEREPYEDDFDDEEKIAAMYDRMKKWRG